MSALLIWLLMSAQPPLSGPVTQSVPGSPGKPIIHSEVAQPSLPGKTMPQAQPAPQVVSRGLQCGPGGCMLMRSPIYLELAPTYIGVPRMDIYKLRHQFGRMRGLHLRLRVMACCHSFLY